MTLSKTKPTGDARNQHERFVRDAIARSLLTLPFASLDADDPFGVVYGYYKQLLESSATGELPANEVLTSIVSLIQQDATIHESAGNYLKADIERRWSEGLLLHFSFGQELTPPGAALRLTTEEVAALRRAGEHVRVHMAHQHSWTVRDTAMGAISKVLAAATPTVASRSSAKVAAEADPANGIFDGDPYEGPTNKKGDW